MGKAPTAGEERQGKKGHEEVSDDNRDRHEGNAADVAVLDVAGLDVDELDVEEFLVEEVSIDGMCGVY